MSMEDMKKSQWTPAAAAWEVGQGPQIVDCVKRMGAGCDLSYAKTCRKTLLHPCTPETYSLSLSIYIYIYYTLLAQAVEESCDT